MWESNWLLALSARGIEPETGAIVIVVLVVAFSWIARWVKAGARPAMLIKDGCVDGTVLRRCKVTDEALQEVLERHDLRTFAEVERAYVDHDGVITLVKRRHADCWSPQHAL